MHDIELVQAGKSWNANCLSVGVFCAASTKREALRLVHEGIILHLQWEKELREERKLAIASK